MILEKRMLESLLRFTSCCRIFVETPENNPKLGMFLFAINLITLLFGCKVSMFRGCTKINKQGPKIDQKFIAVHRLGGKGSLPPLKAKILDPTPVETRLKRLSVYDRAVWRVLNFKLFRISKAGTLWVWMALPV